VTAELGAPSAPDLRGRVAVVTGASRGVGRAIAIALADAGAEVAAVSRTGSDVGLPVTGDVRSTGEVARIAEQVGRRLGPVTVLVNAAGIYGPLRPVADGDPAAWIDTIMTNTVAPYLTCRAFLPGMLAAGWGRIVNISSAASLHPPDKLNSAYGTSKVALNQFTRHLAAELAGTGVTANVLHPGEIKTAMWRDIGAQLAGAGPDADGYRDWFAWVDRTGGDPVRKAGAAVLAIVAGQANGIFHWVEDPLQAPLPSWPMPAGENP
jgi:NAD(P)-dependent dehydrogenase (short-subunit alcohol dehydrogenase family)